MSEKSQAAILRNNSAEVIELLKTGQTKKAIGERFGVSVNAVKEFTKKNGLNNQVSKITEVEAARRIFEKTDGRFEYVSGYTNKDASVIVRCTICKTELERTYHHLTTSNRNACPECIKRNKAKETEQKERNKQRKKAERFNRSELLTMKVCVECGSLFIPRNNNNIRCSVQCIRRSTNRGPDKRLNHSNVVDKDITLTKLFVRDNGTCWLCGKKCDWQDQTQNENGIVCGNNYPSIDHVLPLSKGGLHSWDNVRLAHRHCNTLKRDKTVQISPP